MRPEAKRLFNRVMRELIRKFEYDTINEIDVTDFKYEDYEDVIMEFANVYYNEYEYHGFYPSINLKKFIKYHGENFI